MTEETGIDIKILVEQTVSRLCAELHSALLT